MLSSVHSFIPKFQTYFRLSLDATIKQLGETRVEIEKTRTECQDFMKKFREEEDARNRCKKK
jgi:hypothetical protein